MARYLLDTHIYLWLNDETEKLPQAIDKIVQDDNNELIISMATIWEIQIKYQLKKLILPKPFKQMISEIKSENLYTILPINEHHILNLQNLEFFHKDPFDRIIISQAMLENLTLLTVDEHIIKYPIDFINN